MKLCDNWNIIICFLNFNYKYSSPQLPTNPTTRHHYSPPIPQQTLPLYHSPISLSQCRLISLYLHFRSQSAPPLPSPPSSLLFPLSPLPTPPPHSIYSPPSRVSSCHVTPCVSQTRHKQVASTSSTHTKYSLQNTQLYIYIYVYIYI